MFAMGKQSSLFCRSVSNEEKNMPTKVNSEITLKSGQA